MDDHNHQLISLDSEYNVRVWDVRRFVTVQVIATVDKDPVSLIMHDATQHTLLLAHTHPDAHPSIFAHLNAVARGKDGKKVAATPKEAEAPRRDRSLLGAITSTTLALALAVDEGSTVRSWHCADGQPCFRFQLEKAQTESSTGDEDDASETASAVSFDHSGRRLLVGRQDGKVRVYNFSSGQVTPTQRAPPTLSTI